MLPVLVVLFVVVPVVELFVIVQTGQAIGFLNTLLLLLLMSVAGGWLVKREGLGVARRVQQQMQLGRVPSRELVDGFLILFAGALLLTPGFFTDILAIALLLPPVRAVIRPVLIRRLRGRVVINRAGRSFYDAESWEDDPNRGSLEP